MDGLCVKVTPKQKQDQQNSVPHGLGLYLTLVDRTPQAGENTVGAEVALYFG